MAATHVVLVDIDDRPIGTEDKLRAHELGTLHRAVSVFVFDATGALILQQRAATKYHSGGLWSNSACTHPQRDETPLAAAQRCLREELGTRATLRPAFRFRYRSAVPPGLIEHEYDHVFVGTLHDPPLPAPEEVAAWRAAAPNEIARDVARNPEAYTAWLRIALPLFQEWRTAGGEQLGNPFYDTVLNAEQPC